MSQHKPSPGLTLAISNPGVLMHGCKAFHRFTRQGGTLGSQQCDWHLLDRTLRIHPLHCEIRWREDSFCVIDHSGQTYMNGSDLSLSPGTHVRLRSKDQLQIGDYLIIACVDEADEHTGTLSVVQHSLTELLNGEQCPLMELTRRCDTPTTQVIDSPPEQGAALDPLAALEAATREAQGHGLFDDLFTRPREAQ